MFDLFDGMLDLNGDENIDSGENAITYGFFDDTTSDDDDDDDDE